MVLTVNDVIILLCLGYTGVAFLVIYWTNKD